MTSGLGRATAKATQRERSHESRQADTPRYFTHYALANYPSQAMANMKYF